MILPVTRTPSRRKLQEIAGAERRRGRNTIAKAGGEEPCDSAVDSEAFNSRLRPRWLCLPSVPELLSFYKLFCFGCDEHLIVRKLFNGGGIRVLENQVTQDAFTIRRVLQFFILLMASFTNRCRNVATYHRAIGVRRAQHLSNERWIYMTQCHARGQKMLTANQISLMMSVGGTICDRLLCRQVVLGVNLK